jgi:hypothetical protein
LYGAASAYTIPKESIATPGATLVAFLGALARRLGRELCTFSGSFLKIPKTGSLSFYRSTQAEISPIKADIAKINDTTKVTWGRIDRPTTNNIATQKPVHQLQVIR